MSNIKYKLIKLYNSGKYDQWLSLFNQYVNEGYGVDFESIKTFLIILMKTNEFDKAYEIIKRLEKYLDKYNMHEDIAQLYFLCRKPREALRIYNSMNTKVEKSGLLVRILLLNGDIKRAEEIVNEELSKNPNNEIFLDFKFKINNHRKLGAYIETEYNCFKEQGNRLEVGHIVFLYDAPQQCNKGKTISDAIRRPYLIWRIEGDNIYLFPVCANCREQDYRLYLQKYPNSIGDRRLIDEIYASTIDNIYSVEDKVYKDDYFRLLDGMFFKLYYRKDDKNFPIVYTFLKYIKGEPRINNIIETRNIDTKERRYYFVLEVDNDEYVTIELDYLALRPVSTDIVRIKNDTVYYTVKELIKPQIELVLERYNNMLGDKNKGLTLS